jgi:hypothetical protein
MGCQTAREGLSILTELLWRVRLAPPDLAAAERTRPPREDEKLLAARELNEALRDMLFSGKLAIRRLLLPRRRSSIDRSRKSSAFHT